MNKRCYTRPNKPRWKPVTKRSAPAVARPPSPLPEPVVVHRGSECHVTPPAVAARMVAYLGSVCAGPVLEPSAGTGSLLQALGEVGCHQPVTAVERVQALAEGLRARYPGTAVYHSCFLEFATTASGGALYQRVLMNPPFRQVKQHLAAALRLLDTGGVLVALVPVTYQNPEAETLEMLPPDTFATTKVHTKIIRITR